MANVENCQFLKRNSKFFSVISVKWKQSVCSITLPYSTTFYSLFLPFFVLEIFKLKYDKFFVRHSTSTSRFEWFEQPRVFTFNIKSMAPPEQHHREKTTMFYLFTPCALIRVRENRSQRGFWENLKGYCHTSCKRITWKLFVRGFRLDL